MCGAMMALHSVWGYTGGFIGPIGVGFVLDFVERDGGLAWGLAIGHLARIGLAGLIVIRRLSPLQTSENSADRLTG
ncbi:hypothetical protein [Muricoccus radiodurans]|uniref:hypothetical protein n=1 Tax=Muricoccus radiodurans TaxID=2231721 RepID=UPI003CEB8D0A